MTEGIRTEAVLKSVWMLRQTWKTNFLGSQDLLALPFTAEVLGTGTSASWCPSLPTTPRPSRKQPHRAPGGYLTITSPQAVISQD